MSLKNVFGLTSMWYLVLFLIVNAVADISLDYYFDTDKPLRKLDNHGACTNEETTKYCKETCGTRHLCLLGLCFCVKEFAISDDGLVIQTEELSVETEGAPAKSFEEIAQEEDPGNLELYNFETELVEHPALRHHIAHFCPNLDKARECIYKCMEIGKPAFCGKDHVCYCGHRYDTPTKDPEVDPEVIANQFSDLYEKYFGPQFKKTVLTAEELPN